MGQSLHCHVPGRREARSPGTFGTTAVREVEGVVPSDGALAPPSRERPASPWGAGLNGRLARIVQKSREPQPTLLGALMKKKSIIVSSFLTFGAFGAMAQATAPAPAAPASAPEPTPSPFSANINLTTKYKFRGQDQGGVTLDSTTGLTKTSTFSPAIQGGFDWTMNGFYLGNWDSNIGFTNAGIEMDFYGGYKGEIAKDFGYDVGILQYYYPQKDKVVSFNVTELYGALSWQWLTVKYSHTVSKDYFGIGAAQEIAGSTPRPSGRNTGYIEAAANFPIDKWTINTHIGYTRYSKGLRNATFDGGEGAVDIGVPNYYDYKLGVTYDLGSGFSVAGAVVGASKKSFYGDINKPRAIFTLSKTM
jgi:uncharacterized protein (TIGR02001 family)